MKIDSKQAILEFFNTLEKATVKYRQTGNGRFSFGSSGTHYSQDESEIEGFLRLLWGVGPVAGTSGLADFYQGAILAGVNPESENYWGEIADYHHLMVEMASLSVTLMHTKTTFWTQLTGNQQEMIVSWLDQLNHFESHSNNWLFFRILTNVAFINLGVPANQGNLEADLAKIHQMYIGEGWYVDGNPHQMDYYIPWAFHFYGLVYAKFMADYDPVNSQLFKERASLFAQSYRYWFDSRGAGIPFGRSLTYRFAQSAFWSALVFADVEALPWGEIKELLFGNLTYWSNQQMLKKDGILSIGYNYDNLLMSESYNGPGSPYWALKTFLILAVPDSHPFWQAERCPGTKESYYKNQATGMIFQHNQADNAMLFPTNQFTNQLHATEKYSKFVYSSQFGFSVSKGAIGLVEGAFDNTLALAEFGSHHYVTKEQALSSYLADNYLYHQWAPMPEVEIISYIIPVNQWHLRVHHIDSKRKLSLADGGFANGALSSQPNSLEKATECRIGAGTMGRVESLGLVGYQRATLIYPSTNTNLLVSNTVLPTLLATHQPGKQVYISLHGCSTTELEEPPIVSITGNQLMIPAINFSLSIPI